MKKVLSFVAFLFLTGFSQAQSFNEKQALVQEFLASMERKSLEGIANTLHENVIQEMPFSPEWFPKKVDGKEELLQLFAPVAQNKSVKFINLKLRNMVDKNVVLAEFEGRITTADDIHYNNTYINLFTISEGKIIYIKEYFNPLILNQAFGPME